MLVSIDVGQRVTLIKRKLARDMVRIPGFNREVADVARKRTQHFLRRRLVLCGGQPLEAAPMQPLQHNWSNQGDIADLRQDVYVQVFEAAKQRILEQAKAFVFQLARNLLINHVRREPIIPIEAAANAEALSVAVDAPGPERVLLARDELRGLQMVLDRLPPRCRGSTSVDRYLRALVHARIPYFRGRGLISSAVSR